MTSRLVEYFNRQPRIGSLATAGPDGTVDVAVMGSARMVDDRTVVMGSGANRTLANLRGNPHAVFMIVEPGQAITDWKGVRVYLAAREIATAGPAFEAFVDEAARVAGEEIRALMTALVTFDVTDVRPILDMGQGWEASI